MRSKIFACHEKEYLNLLKINTDSFCLVLVVWKVSCCEFDNPPNKSVRVLKGWIRRKHEWRSMANELTALEVVARWKSDVVERSHVWSRLANDRKEVICHLDCWRRRDLSTVIVVNGHLWFQIIWQFYYVQMQNRYSHLQ